MSIATTFEFLKHDDYALTLLGVGVVILAARALGWLFVRMHQPRVIGEVIAGILLGPTLLGGFSEDLFPLDARPMLRMLAVVGVVVFMFLVGLELDLGLLSRDRRRLAGGVALGGNLLPFALGIALAYALYPMHDDADFLPFALFIGLAMSITAFPVLARILVERGIWDKPLGVVAMAAAAIDDVLAWSWLAFVVAIITSNGAWDLPVICALAVAFTVIMIKVVRPLLRRFADRDVDPTILSLVFVGVFVCSFATSAIGIHEIFGAFLFGAVFPRGELAHQIRSRLETVTLFLLPVFFVTAGLNVDIRGLSSDALWAFPLILLVAFGGKFAGAILGATTQGIRPRDALGIGALMNTRGLTELIVLSVGLQLGVLDTELYSLFVLMAVTTTVVTAPLLALIKPDPYLATDDAAEPSPRWRFRGRFAD